MAQRLVINDESSYWVDEPEAPPVPQEGTLEYYKHMMEAPTWASDDGGLYQRPGPGMYQGDGFLINKGKIYAHPGQFNHSGAPIPKVVRDNYPMASQSEWRDYMEVKQEGGLFGAIDRMMPTTVAGAAAMFGGLALGPLLGGMGVGPMGTALAKTGLSTALSGKFNPISAAMSLGPAAFGGGGGALGGGSSPYTYTANDGALGDAGSFNATSVDVNDAGGSMDYDYPDMNYEGGGDYQYPDMNYEGGGGSDTGFGGNEVADAGMQDWGGGFPSSLLKMIPDAAKKLLFGESGKGGLIGGALSGNMGSIAKTALIAGAIKDLLSNQSIPLADETKAALKKSLEAADAFATQNAPALSGNQNAAIAYARDNAGAGRGALTESRDLLNRSAVGPTAAEVDTYVNPYTKGALQENLHYLGDSAVGPTGADIEQYLNPFTRNVIDVALADQERANAKLVNADAAKAMGVGAFGGSRALMQEKEMRDAGLRAMGATSGALGRDAYDKSLKAAFDVKDNQFRVGDVAAKGLNTIYDKGLDATFRGKDNMRAAGTALTTNAGEEFKNYIDTTGALAETGAIEQQPEVVRYNQKRDAANLYGNAAANASRAASALKPPSPLGQLGSAFGVYNAANKALGVL